MIKVGICGLGFMGNMHAACYAAIPGVRIEAVADVLPERLEKVGKDRNVPGRFSKAKDLIAKADVDIVSICLPTYMHAEHAILTAQRGLDCLCEKPMALASADATLMVKAARKAKKRLMIGQVIRFWPEYQVLKEMTTSKKRLGALKSAVFNRFVTAPAGWKNWFHNSKLSGSAALDLHIHDADYVRYLCGDPKSLDSVGTMDGEWCSQVATNYHYPGVAITATGGWWASGEPFEMSFRAVFEKGVMQYSSKSMPLTLYQDGKKPVAMDVPRPTTGSIDAGGNISDLGGYYNEVKYFIDCVKAGKEPEIVTPEEARDSVALVQKEVASAAKKQKK